MTIKSTRIHWMSNPYACWSHWRNAGTYRSPKCCAAPFESLQREGNPARTRHPRPIAGFPARAPGRCPPMGAGAEGRAPGGVSLAAFQVRMIHLDTSFLIRALAPGSPEDRKLRGWMGEGETLGMSAVAWAELLCGPLERSEMEWVAEIVGQRQDLSARSNASFSAAIPITRTCPLASEGLLLPGGANVRSDATARTSSSCRPPGITSSPSGICLA